MRGAEVLRRRGAELRFRNDAKWCQGYERGDGDTRQRARRRERGLRAAKKWSGTAEEQVETTREKRETRSGTYETPDKWVDTRG